MQEIRVLRRALPAIVFLAASAHAATLQVGPGQAYSKPCAAITAASPGDTILIDAAGDYTGDVCIWYTDNLTILGVNGRPKIAANGNNAAGKGIWVVDGNNNTIENIELSGAVVPDGNGAGIRGEGLNLTVRYCYLHNNQDGILTNDNNAGTILIEFCEFAYNGTGNGYTHNIYVGTASEFTLRFSYSHDAVGGQLVKSRAAETHLLYNRLTSEAGTTSFPIDICNGGLTYIIGNVVEQGVNDQNSNMLAYMLEGPNSFHPSWQLFIVNNTFVNDKSYGTFLDLSSSDTTPAVVTNNIFYGPGTVTTQASAILSNNYTGTNPMFVNESGYDYHLQAGSPAINAGAVPGTGAGLPLTPDSEYVHPACGEARVTQGTIDIGAYEYGGAGTPAVCAPPGGTTPAPAASGAVSIWSSSAVPGTPYVAVASPLTVGVKFQSDVAGTVQGIRFYKGAGNTGTHIGLLYSSTGAVLAQATFTNETASGWQQVNFATPVAITANTVYVAAFFTTTACAYDAGYFTASGVDNAPLHALKSGVAGGNGVYAYANGPAFPAQTYGNANYWVDVAFTPAGTPPPASLTLSCAAATAQAGTAYTSALAAGGGVAPFTYSIVSGALPGGLTLNSSTGAIAGTPAAAGTFTYTAKATDAAGGSATASCSLTVSAAAAGTTMSIWPASAVPGTPHVAIASPLTVGVKFRSDSAGAVHGIRFYKGLGDTGTHIGLLYSATGTLLGQVAFSGETASGWQEADFISPVAIAANTTYIAAIFTTAASAYDAGYFTAKGVDHAPLHALQSGVDGPNGVYVYSTGPQFPSQSYGDANYWVDVAFAQN